MGCIEKTVTKDKKDKKQTAYERIASERRFKISQKETINTARELFYDEWVIKKLHSAKTESELSRIMCDARKNASELYELDNMSKSGKLSNEEKKLCNFKKQAIKKAIDLEYSFEIISKLKVAVSENAVKRIMQRARMTGGI